MENKFRLELVGITYNQIESGVYALILQQVGTSRRIPIIIGFPEAQAIECKLQEISTPRPLTHDIMVSALATFGISLLEVDIYKLPTGVFAANLIFSNGREHRIVDARSSDAVALAIRVGAPIYTSESVLRESGFEASDKVATQPDNNPAIHTSTISPVKAANSSSGKNSQYDAMSLAQLSEAMIKAAEHENYEEAARLKNEIDKRNSQKSI